jgi:toxin YoeB
MEVIFLPVALDHLEFWKKSGNKSIQKRISALIADILKNPTIGIGKPEPLKHQLTGKWSRRINQEHRIIYSVENKTVYIYSLKGHY